MPLCQDPRTTPREIVRLTYRMDRSKRSRVARAAQREQVRAKMHDVGRNANHACLWKERCPVCDAPQDPRWMGVDHEGKPKSFCGVCAKTEEVGPKSYDEAPAPEGDWRYWPTDCLPGVHPWFLNRLATRFLFIGELRGLTAQQIRMRGICEPTAESIVAAVRKLVQERGCP